MTVINDRKQNYKVLRDSASTNTKTNINTINNHSNTAAANIDELYLGGVGSTSRKMSQIKGFKTALILIFITAIVRNVDANPVNTTAEALASTQPAYSSPRAVVSTDWLMCAGQRDSGNKSYCSIDIEQTLLDISTDELNRLFVQRLKPYEERYRLSYVAVIQNATAAIQQAEKDMQLLFSEAYGSLYDENRIIFDRLYVSLSWYARSTLPLLGGQRFHQKAEYSVAPATSIRRIFHSFFVQLTDRLVRIRAPQLSDQLTEDRINCIIAAVNNASQASTSRKFTANFTSVTVQSFARLLNESLYVPLERNLVAIRVWVNLLTAITRFSKESMANPPITEECRRAYGAVKMCHRCSSISASTPCQQTCEVVAQTCINLPSDFTTTWKQLFDTASAYWQMNDLNLLLESLPTNLYKFPRDLSHAISNASLIDFPSVLADPVFQHCDQPPSRAQDSGRTEAADSAATGATAAINGNERLQYDKNFFVASFLNSTPTVFQEVESAIISALCQGSGQENNCWNGVTLLRTNARQRLSDPFMFDTALNFTHQQSQSVQLRTQFYDRYTALFREYADQIRSGGVTPAGYALLNIERPTNEACDTDAASSNDDENASETRPDCANEDPSESGQGSTTDDDSDLEASGDDAPNSDDEDGFEGSADYTEESSGTDYEEGSADLDTEAEADAIGDNSTTTSSGFSPPPPEKPIDTPPVADSIAVQGRPDKRSAIPPPAASAATDARALHSLQVSITCLIVVFYAVSAFPIAL